MGRLGVGRSWLRTEAIRKAIAPKKATELSLGGSFFGGGGLLFFLNLHDKQTYSVDPLFLGTTLFLPHSGHSIPQFVMSLIPESVN